MIEAAVADPTIPEFDQQQAVDELKQYLWAGTETTALTLAWALYLTSRQPEAAERIRREGEAVYGDREPTAADYSALAYTRAVIQETMRLYPPIWMLIRVAAKPDVIDGKEIRAGDRVALFAYGAHHNAKYWDEPGGVHARALAGRRRQEAQALHLSAVRRRQALVHRRRHEPGREHAGAVDPAAPLPPEYVGPEPPGINATVTLTPRAGCRSRFGSCRSGGSREVGPDGALDPAPIGV